MLRSVKATAVVVLLSLVSLNGAGVLLAYSEANLAQGQSCGRECCNLSKSGAGYASSCCAVRCGDDVGQSGSEPAREPTAAGKLQATPTTLSTPIEPTRSIARNRLSAEIGAGSPADGQPDLNIQHSVFLV